MALVLRNQPGGFGPLPKESMQFVPVPKFPCTDAEMQAFRDILNIPRNLVLFPDTRLVNGIQPAEGDVFKPWRDNSAVWRDDPTLTHFCIEPMGRLLLSYRERIGDAGKNIPDVAGIVDLEKAGYSRDAVTFYNERVIAAKGGEFTRVPFIGRAITDRQSAANLNLVIPGGPVVRWPIGIPAGDANVPNTINPNVAFRFNPQTNWPEAFLIADYNREFPLNAAPTGKLTDQELVNEVGAILASGMPVPKQAEAIRKVAK